MGMSDVLAIDLNEKKLDLASEAGSLKSSSPLSDDVKNANCDVIFDCAGNAASFNTAIDAAGPRADVILVGIPAKSTEISNLNHQKILRQELCVRGAWNSFTAPFPGEQWEVALEHFISGRLKWEFMVSHRIELKELPKILYAIMKGELTEYSKILIRP